MPGQNTSPDSATLRQDSPVSMAATNTLAALFTEPSSDLQKAREAYKRAAAARRARKTAQ